MPIKIFKEEYLTAKEGICLYHPEYTTSNVHESIDVVYFPFMVHEGILKDELFDKMNAKVPKECVDPRARFEYMNKILPLHLINLYQEKLKRQRRTLHRKPLVFFHISDFSESYGLDSNIIILRVCANRSTISDNDIIMPFYVPYSKWGGPQKKIKPSLGFCGCPFTHPSRLKAINEIHSSQSIEFNKMFTKVFFHHIQSVIDKQNPHLQQEERNALSESKKSEMAEHFKQILSDNIFSFCPRGRGNTSIRFYETLREGRIPVMIDSDQVLPYEDRIDWSDIVICAKDVNELIQTIHDWTNKRDLIALQKRCREIWENYLTKEKFFEILPNYIERYLSER